MFIYLFLLIGIVYFFNTVRTKADKSSSIRSLHALVAGFAVTMIVGLVIGQGNFLGFFMLTIICTLGTGLLVWLAVWYILGFIVIISFQMMTGKYQPSTKLVLTPAQKSVVTYIIQAQKSGLNKTAIEGNLQSKGWKDEDVKIAFKHLPNPDK